MINLTHYEELIVISDECLNNLDKFFGFFGLYWNPVKIFGIEKVHDIKKGYHILQNFLEDIKKGFFSISERV